MNKVMLHMMRCNVRTVSRSYKELSSRACDYDSILIDGIPDLSLGA